jgi:crotonobetainyl-CoA:carnitine CoA-transferase CaiB-like acyl-CoA transferase
MLANLGANYLVSGNTPGRAGNAHQNIVPYQVFEVKPAMNATSNARDHLILAVGNDGQFAKFCDVAGHPELATDARFSKNTERVKNRKVLVPLLENIMMARTKAQWLPDLESAKVPCGAINNLSEVFADPQVLARNMINTWQHPHQKDLQLVASPLKLSLTPVRADHAPPQLGQHSAQILNEVLGYSETQIEQLQSKGVI